MHLLDHSKYLYSYLRTAGRNRQFVREHPEVALPPDYLMFESYRLDYRRYYYLGRESAQAIIDQLSPHLALANQTILDWGCGPARVMRHLPQLLPEASLYGTDYNPKTIAWCQAHIPDVQFSLNGIDPPTEFGAEFFDAIYGISIFTHLSAVNHTRWFDELIRILKPRGVLLLTTHGDAYQAKLTKAEQVAYEAGELVTRGKVREGHRVYAAFHPPAFLRKMFEAKAEILEHTPGQVASWGIEQDRWILRKR